MRININPRFKMPEMHGGLLLKGGIVVSASEER